MFNFKLKFERFPSRDSQSILGAVFFLELCFVQPGVCDRVHPIKAMVPQSKGCRRYLLKRPFNLNRVLHGLGLKPIDS